MKFMTDFKNWEDALHFGHAGDKDENTFKNYEIELIKTNTEYDEEWGSHICQ